MGSAPRRSTAPNQNHQMAGTTPTRWTTIVGSCGRSRQGAAPTHVPVFCIDIAAITRQKNLHTSEELAQIHIGIEARDLVGIAIEWQRRVALGEEPALANFAFGLLAPTRVIDFRIHVRVETIFVGVLFVPTGRRHFRNQPDPHDRLDALEAVFPRHHQAQGRPVLVWQILVVETDRQDGERVYGFVETQALDIRPIEGLEKATLARHLAWPFQRLKGDELSVSLRLGTLDHTRERKANPRDDHRPTLDTAMAKCAARARRA